MIITSRTGQSHRHQVSDGVIAYEDHSAPSYAVATSISKTTRNAPAGAVTVAFVMARSDLTPPAGWSLITSKTCSNASVARHDLLVYIRDSRAALSPTSLTWTQATSGRIGVGYVCVRNDSTATRVIHVSDKSSSSNINSTSTLTIASNVLTAGRTAQEMFLIFATSVIASPSTTTITIPSGATTLCAGLGENRLGGCYQTRTPGQSNSGGDFVFGTGPADNGLATITLRIIGGF